VDPPLDAQLLRPGRGPGNQENGRTGQFGYSQVCKFTRKFILSDGRIEVDSSTIERSTCASLCKTAAKRQKLGAEPTECADENADTRVRNPCRLQLK
jgi:hypothetical protein